MGSLGRDVLRELRQKIERGQDLIVPLGRFPPSTNQRLASSPGDRKTERVRDNRCPSIEPQFVAESAEVALAKFLRKCGYGVWQN
jgi:hypothetical protein